MDTKSIITLSKLFQCQALRNSLQKIVKRVKVRSHFLVAVRLRISWCDFIYLSGWYSSGFSQYSASLCITQEEAVTAVPLEILIPCISTSSAAFLSNLINTNKISSTQLAFIRNNIQLTTLRPLSYPQISVSLSD